MKLWHNTTYRLENTLNYGMERVWAVGYQKGSNSIGIGYDEGGWPAAGCLSTWLLRWGCADQAVTPQ